MAFGMAGNLFHPSHNFLTHKRPNLSTKRHLFRHTEILWLIRNDCLRPSGYFSDPACPCTVVYICIKKIAILLIDKRIAIVYIVRIS